MHISLRTSVCKIKERLLKIKVLPSAIVFIMKNNVFLKNPS